MEGKNQINYVVTESREKEGGLFARWKNLRMRAENGFCELWKCIIGLGSN